MSRSILPICIMAASLSGCLAVPYDDDPYVVYSPAPVYGPPYAVAPGYGYAAPGTVYGSPVYVTPPAQSGLGLHYRSGGRFIDEPRRSPRQARAFGHGHGLSHPHAFEHSPRGDRKQRSGGAFREFKQ